MLRPYKRSYVGAKHERDYFCYGVKVYLRSCFALSLMREHPVFETTLVRAKHSDYQLLVLTERLFARMLRPYIIGMLTSSRLYRAPSFEKKIAIGELSGRWVAVRGQHTLLCSVLRKVGSWRFIAVFT
jgi:hypothetical protein